MSDKISSKSASISTIPDAEITIPDAKINTWYKDGERRWRVLERETNWEKIDLIPSRIQDSVPFPPCEIPSQAEGRIPLSEDPGNAKKLEEGAAIGDGKLGGSKETPSIGDPIYENESEKNDVSLGQSGGSLRSQSGTLKEGSIGHRKSGGQPEERQSLSEDSGNATKLKNGAGTKKKSGFWNCCSGGSTGSGYPSEDGVNLSLSENPEKPEKLNAGAVNPQMKGEDGSSSLDKSGAAVSDESRSLSGAGSQSGSQTNENNEGGSKGSAFIGNPKNENESEKDANSHGKSGGSLRSQSGTLKEGSIGHGKSGGQPEERLSLSEDSATKLKEKKSGFWNCCSGGSTGSGYPSEDGESLSLSEKPEKMKAGAFNPQMIGEDGSSSLDKSGAADETGSLGAGSQRKFGLYDRSRSLTGSLSNEKVGLDSAKTLAENAGCLRGMDISMDCTSLPYRERREVHWIEQINKAKEEIQACLPLSVADQDGSNFMKDVQDILSNFEFSVMIPYAIGGILFLVAVGVALYLHLIGINDM